MAGGARLRKQSCEWNITQRREPVVRRSVTQKGQNKEKLFTNWDIHTRTRYDILSEFCGDTLGAIYREYLRCTTMPHDYITSVAYLCSYTCVDILAPSIGSPVPGVVALVCAIYQEYTYVSTLHSSPCKVNAISAVYLHLTYVIIKMCRPEFPTIHVIEYFQSCKFKIHNTIVVLEPSLTVKHQHQDPVSPTVCP